MEQNSALQVDDISSKFASLFTDETRAALNNTATTQFTERYIGNGEYETDQAIYLGATVADRNLHLAAEKIAKDLNALSKAGFLKSSIMKLGKVQLAVRALELESIVFSYVHVPADKVTEAKALCSSIIREGEVPPLVELN